MTQSSHVFFVYVNLRRVQIFDAFEFVGFYIYEGLIMRPLRTTSVFCILCQPALCARPLLSFFTYDLSYRNLGQRALCARSLHTLMLKITINFLQRMSVTHASSALIAHSIRQNRVTFFNDLVKLT